MTPLISFVIPVFNQENYAVETVLSACEQTYRNLEIIVIDDGSEDESFDRIQRIDDDRIKLYRQQNLGPSIAVNRGIAVAQGEYIALLGGDDICEKFHIGHQLALLSETRSDIVFSVPNLIDKNGLLLADEEFPIFSRELKDGILRELFLRQNFICASTALMRASVPRVLKGFHPGLLHLQDFDFWLRAAVKGMKIRRNDDVRSVNYRRHEANLSHTKGSFASDCELPIAYARAMKIAEPRLLRETFPYLFLPVIDIDEPLSLLDHTLVLMSHASPFVKELGARYAIEAIEVYNDGMPFGDERASEDINLIAYLRNSLTS